MAEKFEYKPKSSEEISEYIVERLKRENVSKEEPRTAKEKLTPEMVQAKATELVDLIEEKEGLIKNKIADEKLIAGQEEKPKGKALKVGRGVYFNSVQMHESLVKIEEENLVKMEAEIAQLVNNEQVAEKCKEIFRKKVDAIRLAREVEKKEDEVFVKELESAALLAHRNNEDLKLAKSDKQKLESDKEEIGQKNKEKEELMKVPEVQREVERRQLLDYRRQLLKDGFVETPSVKEEIAQILGHLELGIPVFLRGHLGAGKTENLLHISRKYYGAEPEFISGSEEATKYDIYGKTQIGARSEEDKVKEFKIRLDEYQNMNPKVTGKDLKKVEKEYYDMIVVKGQTTSFFQYGPLVRAMKEGRPIIIDEIDGIPHSILMRLNHVLTRKSGDKVKIQENGGEEIEVKKGFCVMATGNIKSAKYKREELDAAFLSRWWSSEIKYLPEEEMLKVITASLIDKRGNLELNSLEDFKAIRKLTQAATEIQKIFTGDKTDVFGEGGDAARGVSASLEKSVLSMRDIWNIVKPWKAHNFDKSLDDYILNEFIKKSTVPKDTVYLTQLFCRFGFFKDWEAEKFGITGLDNKKLEAFRGKKS